MTVKKRKNKYFLTMTLKKRTANYTVRKDTKKAHRIVAVRFLRFV